LGSANGSSNSLGYRSKISSDLNQVLNSSRLSASDLTDLISEGLSQTLADGQPSVVLAWAWAQLTVLRMRSSKLANFELNPPQTKAQIAYQSLSQGLLLSSDGLSACSIGFALTSASNYARVAVAQLNKVVIIGLKFSA
jgi:hypothetical protein